MTGDRSVAKFTTGDSDMGDRVTLNGTGLASGVAIVTGIGDDVVTISDTGPQSATLVQSGAGDDRVSIESTAANSSTEIQLGSGSDVAVLRSTTDTLDTILGDVLVDGGGNLSGPDISRDVVALGVPVSLTLPIGDRLVLDDSGNADSGTFGIRAATISRTGFTSVMYDSIETISLATGSNEDRVTVFESGTNANVSVDTNDGDDVLIVRDTGTESILQADLGAGSDTLLVLGTGVGSVTHFDSAAGEDAVNVVGSGDGSGIQIETGIENDTVTIAAVGMDSVNHIDTGRGDDRVTIESTAQDSSTEVHLGLGTDTAVVRSDTNQLDEILGDVMFVGQGDDGPDETFNVRASRLPISTTVRNGDRLVLDDSGNSSTSEHEFQADRYRGSATGTVFFETLEVISLVTGTGEDEVTVRDTPARSRVEIETGTGSDRLIVRDTGSRSVLEADTGENDDTVVVAMTGDRSVAKFTSGDSDMGDRVTINGSGLASGIAIVTGIGDDVVKISDTGPQSATLVQSGAGDDRVSIESTAANSSTEIQLGSGSDVAVLRSTTDTLDTILGDVLVDGGGNLSGPDISRDVVALGVPVSLTLPIGDRLVLDDSGNADSGTFGIRAATISRTGFTSVMYDSIETISLATGSNEDRVTVFESGTNANVSVDTNDGDDVLIVRDTGTESILQADLGAGSDTLLVLGTGVGSVTHFDSAAGEDAVNVVGSGDGSGIQIETGIENDTVTIAAVGMDSVNHIDTGDGEDTLTIETLAIGSTTEVGLGDGNDLAILKSDTDLLGGFLGDVQISGNKNDETPTRSLAAVAKEEEVEVTNAIGDRLILDDSGNSADTDFQVTPTMVSGPTGTAIMYHEIETLSLATGSGDDSVDIDGTAVASSLLVDTAEGVDRIHVRDTGVSGIVDVDAGNGNNVVSIESTGRMSVSRFVAGTGEDRIEVTGTGRESGLILDTAVADDSVTIAAVGIQSVNRIATGEGEDRVTVQTTAVNSTTEIGLGEGNDIAVFRSTDNRVRGLHGDIAIAGDDNDANPRRTLTVSANDESVTADLSIGDRLVIDDSGSPALSNFVIEPTMITGPNSSTVMYRSIETVSLFTGSNSDTIEVTDTLSDTSFILETNDGDDQLILNDTGLRSIFDVGLGDGDDEIDINETGADSVLWARSDAGNDTVTVNANGGRSGQRVLTGAGDDRVAIHSTANQSVGNYGLGEDSDVIEIGSQTREIVGVRGTLEINGQGGSPTASDVASVTARRSPNNPSDVIEQTQTVEIADTIRFLDDGSTVRGNYELTPTSYERLDRSAFLSYVGFEAILATLSSSSDAVDFTGTADAVSYTLLTGAGDDRVNLGTTGVSSITRIATGPIASSTGSDSDDVIITSTGAFSVLKLNTASGGTVSDDADTVRVIERGSQSAVEIITGDSGNENRDDDNVVIGGPAASSIASESGARSLLTVFTGSGRDVFDVNEVFIDTVVDLSGQAGNDRFNLLAGSADSSGNLDRLNNDPTSSVNPLGLGITRELILDGGSNENLVRTVSDGLLVAADSSASDGEVANLEIGDSVHVDASSVTSPLDLRFVITDAAQAFLGTTSPSNDPNARSTSTNEVLESTNIENILVTSGAGDDVVTLTSQVVFGIENTGQVFGFDGAGGQDIVEVVGTDGPDRITIGAFEPLEAESRDPIEVSGVEFLRADGNVGSDQISNRTDVFSVLDGNQGDDVLSGGSRPDLLHGGADVDFLYGNLGNDFLFSERDQGSSDDQIADNDYLDGGDQDDLVRGDVCLQLGLDRVVNCETISNGGASLDVLTWLRARVIPAGSISTERGSADLVAFAPVENPPATLTMDSANLEPNALNWSASATSVQSSATSQFASRDPLDVSGDGAVTVVDALQIINRIGRVGEGEQSFEFENDAARYDANADGRVSSLDALVVINQVGRTQASTVEETARWYTAVDDWFSLEEERRRAYADEVLQMDLSDLV